MAIVEGIVLATLLVVLARLLFGPTPWDRLLAANSAATRVLLLMAILAVVEDRTLYFDVAIVYAAISFLGIVIVARVMERAGGIR